ncbi:MAG: hypothetical protein QXX19_08825 [Candidatus Caldarchaeum sp.]
MRREEKWTLPVVYVPRGEDKHLLDVVYEVVDVEDMTLVFLWFHWDNDWPFSQEPEYEPLAVVFYDSWPKLAFYRPHNTLRVSRPMLEGRKAIVYISKLGHAPIVSRWEVLLHSLAPLRHTKLGGRRLRSNLVYGEPPVNFLVWKGVNFRDWVLRQLQRPEIVKSIRGRKSNGVLRFIWHMAMASHYGGNGDLRRVYKHLLKGFLALPSTLKTNPYLMYLLDDAIGVKRLIKEGYQLSENDKQRLKTRYVDVAFEAPVQLISQALENLFGKDEFIDTTQTTTPVEQLSTLVNTLRNT